MDQQRVYANEFPVDGDGSQLIPPTEREEFAAAGWRALAHATRILPDGSMPPEGVRFDTGSYTGVNGLAFLHLRAYLALQRGVSLPSSDQRLEGEDEQAQRGRLALQHLERSLALAEACIDEACAQKLERPSLHQGLPGALAVSAACRRFMGQAELCRSRVKDLVQFGWRFVLGQRGEASQSALDRLTAEAAAEQALASPTRDELLTGRAGFLMAVACLQKHCPDAEVPSVLVRRVIDGLLARGRAKADHGRRPAGCPLMFEWHGKRYWGAAHGVLGICHALLGSFSGLLTAAEAKEVRGTIGHLLRRRHGSGNFRSSEASENDRLVHWCHGAPGATMTLARLWSVTRSPLLLRAAEEAGEVVWQRGLLRRLGLCHGVAGNAYALLALYRLFRLEAVGEGTEALAASALEAAVGTTGDSPAASGSASAAAGAAGGAGIDRPPGAALAAAKWLHRARCFGRFLESWPERVASGEMHGGDCPASLYEGSAGVACLFFDLAAPEALDARFPLYELD